MLCAAQCVETLSRTTADTAAVRRFALPVDVSVELQDGGRMQDSSAAAGGPGGCHLRASASAAACVPAPADSFGHSNRGRLAGAAQALLEANGAQPLKLPLIKNKKTINPFATAAHAARVPAGDGDGLPRSRRLGADGAARWSCRAAALRPSRPPTTCSACGPIAYKARPPAQVMHVFRRKCPNARALHLV